MATPSDEIVRQIGRTRGEMESRIVELRTRGQVTVRRTARLAMIGAGLAAGTLLVVAISVGVRRMSRPATFGERLSRLLPARLAGARRAADLIGAWARRRVPPMRLYVGDRQLGEEPPTTRWERIGVRFAQTFATAAASAVVSRLVSRIAPRR